MPYRAEISRVRPTLFVFLLDQSGSMAERFAPERTKAQFLADTLNQILYELVMRCSKADGVRDYFDVAILNYHDDEVYSGLSISSGSRVVHPISEIADNPLRLETVTGSDIGPDGEIHEEEMELPVWIEPSPAGSTPMTKAFTEAAWIVQEWCDAHLDSYPPTVIHISDGVPTDGAPLHEASTIRALSTDDGPALLFNCHVSGRSGEPILFPSDRAALPDEHAQMLFDISSEVPEHLREAAVRRRLPVIGGSRFFVYKASPRDLVHFLNLGTRPATIR